jgi:hypothetical protein
VPPTRLLDTRLTSGTALTGAFVSHVSRSFVVAGTGGVAANAVAVAGNLTVTGQTTGGFLYTGPDLNNSPTTSTLNFPVGDNRANAVVVQLKNDGSFAITFVGSKSTAHAQVIFDVTGYFTPDPGGATFVALTPTRLLDTRLTTGTALTGVFQNRVSRIFAVAGTGGVAPAAIAVTGNLTVTQQTSAGYLYAGPALNNNPTSSNLNFPVGDNRANALIVELGSGNLAITYVASHSVAHTQVIFDVTGYFVN